MSSSIPQPPLLADFRRSTLAGLTTVLALSTAYSVVFDTYVDTSDPLVALGAAQHHLHDHSLFARKSNILNTLFIKNSWAWTSAAFLFLFLTVPSAPIKQDEGQERRPQPQPAFISARERLVKWGIATLVWAVFAAWFFGPAVLERVNALSGGECVLRSPSGDVYAVPLEYCYTKTTLSPATHPHVFDFSELSLVETWKATPRLTRGHDVSGHTFLLTMSLLFLADMLRPSVDILYGSSVDNFPDAAHFASIGFACMLMCIWYFSICVTGVYWHTPLEKLTGWALGVAGFLATQIPVFREPETSRVRKQ